MAESPRSWFLLPVGWIMAACLLHLHIFLRFEVYQEQSRRDLIHENVSGQLNKDVKKLT